MYKDSGGVNHQANITLQLRASGTSSTGTIETTFGQGYVSHSFDQYILVDAERNIVTLDVGDGYPRALAVIRFDAVRDGVSLGDGSRGSRDWYNICNESHVWDIPGQIGNNGVHSNTGAFAETSTGYVTAFCRDNAGSGFASRKIYLGYTTKNGLQSSWKLVSPERSVSVPHLAPTYTLDASGITATLANGSPTPVSGETDRTPTPLVSGSFTDVPASHWAYDDISSAVSLER